MKNSEARPADPPLLAESTSELLILADGKILVHNLTPEFAALLTRLNPADEPIRLRAGQAASVEPPHTHPRP
jgi:hypothetical protein